MAGRLTQEQIAESFARIERELIADAMRNLARHRVDEAVEGFTWEQWQVVQLRNLHEYAQRNVKKYTGRFGSLNDAIERLVRRDYASGYDKVDREAKRALMRGWVSSPSRAAVRGAHALGTVEGSMGIDSARLDALVRSVRIDLDTAERAVLRRASDQYRSIIFDAQVYAASGAGTYDKAVDMATRDFLSKGIDGIVYKNGARHTLPDYTSMVIRTSTKRAGFVAQGEARDDWGVHTIIIDPRSNACPVCMPWIGRVLVDNVYSNGTAEEAQQGGWGLLSDAMTAGLFHPNCKDTMSTYFPGISPAPKSLTDDQIVSGEQIEAIEELERTAERNRRKYERIAAYSLDANNARRAKVRAEVWNERVDAAREAEAAHATTRRNGVVKFDIVESDAYRKMFDKVGNEKLAAGLYDVAVDILKHRNGTLYEDMAVVMAKTGDVLDINKSSKDERSVAHSATARRLLSESGRGTLVVVHNHPESMSPSAHDFHTLYHKSVKFGVIVCHDGSLVKYRVTNRAVFTEACESGSIHEIDSLFADSNDLYGTALGDEMLNRELVESYGVKYERITT